VKFPAAQRERACAAAERAARTYPAYVADQPLGEPVQEYWGRLIDAVFAALDEPKPPKRFYELGHGPRIVDGVWERAKALAPDAAERERLLAHVFGVSHVLGLKADVVLELVYEAASREAEGR